MASNPTAAPILFDRALLRARLERARRGGPATFLLDRVREDMEERLAAVTRNFVDVADIWDAGRIAAKARPRIAFSRSRASIPIIETLPVSNRTRSTLPSRHSPSSSSTISRRAGADPPRAQTRWAVAGGDDRRRYADELRQSFAAAEAECEGGVSPRVAPFADLRDIGALLQRAGWRCRSPTSIASWYATTARSP
jgi:hypothetical protein